MLTIFNRRELLSTFSPETQENVRGALKRGGIAYRLRVRNLTSAVGRSYPRRAPDCALPSGRQHAVRIHFFTYTGTTLRKRPVSSPARVSGYIKQTFRQTACASRAKDATMRKKQEVFLWTLWNLSIYAKAAVTIRVSRPARQTGGGPQRGAPCTVGVQQPALELCRGGKPGGRAPGGRVRAGRRREPVYGQSAGFYYHFRRTRAAFTAHRGHHGQPAFRPDRHWACDGANLPRRLRPGAWHMYYGSF